MSGLRITILNEISGETHRGELPNDVPLRRIIPPLLTRLNLPILDVGGQLLNYLLVHGDRLIPADQTLTEAGVRENDLLRLRMPGQIDGMANPASEHFVLLMKRTVVLPNSVPIPIASHDQSLQDLGSYFWVDDTRRGQPPQISVILWDLVAVCIRPSVDLPGDIAMSRLLPSLAKVSGLPVSIDGTPVHYELRLKSGRSIREEETLAAAGVQRGDTLFFLLSEPPDPRTGKETWLCPVCRRAWEGFWRFCPCCGAANRQFRGHCPQCSVVLPPYPSTRFCPNCGQRIQQDGEADTGNTR